MSTTCREPSGTGTERESPSEQSRAVEKSASRSSSGRGVRAADSGREMEKALMRIFCIPEPRLVKRMPRMPSLGREEAGTERTVPFILPFTCFSEPSGRITCRQPQPRRSGCARSCHPDRPRGRDRRARPARDAGRLGLSCLLPPRRCLVGVCGAAFPSRGEKRRDISARDGIMAREL